MHETIRGPVEPSEPERLERTEEHLAPRVTLRRAGTVRVRKHVVEESGNAEVTLSHDELDIERRPADRPLATGEPPVTERSKRQGPAHAATANRRGNHLTENVGHNHAPSHVADREVAGPGWLGNGRRDRVRWGAVWAGLVTAVATFLLLTTAAVAIGAVAVDSGADPEAGSMASGIASAVIALLAFLAGGFVAARTSGVLGRGYGALNGFMVWGLGVVLILALAAMGLGSLFGASGDLFAQYRELGSPQPEGVDPNAVVDSIRNGSIGAFLGMLLPAIAATVGGLLGSREEAVLETA